MSAVHDESPPPRHPPPAGPEAGARWTLERLRREYCLEIWRQTRQRPAAAARILGIDRRTLESRLERYAAEAGPE